MANPRLLGSPAASRSASTTLLSHLIKEVEELASFYLPPENNAATLADFRYDPATSIEHTLHVEGRGHFLMSDWARAQINSSMGARDKWFDAVSQTEQAAERNKRLHIFKRARLLLSSYPDEDCGLLRGVVGHGYNDVPYTFIAEKLAELLPAGAGSDISMMWSFVDYRVLHIVHISTEEHALPGTSETWCPGILVRSSEVGEASLTVYPVISFGSSRIPIVLKELPRACRIRHNGSSLEQVAQKFEEGLVKATRYFHEPKAMRLLRLQEITYANEDEALEAIQVACRTVKMTRRIEEGLMERYCALEDQPRTGVRILLAMRDMANQMCEKNELAAAEFATWIGALLYQL